MTWSCECRQNTNAKKIDFSVYPDDFKLRMSPKTSEKSIDFRSVGEIEPVFYANVMWKSVKGRDIVWVGVAKSVVRRV